MARSPMNAPSQVRYFRYWGSYFKSRRIATYMALHFEPLVKRGWKCWIGVEKLPEDPAWLDDFKALGVEVVRVPRPRGNFDARCVRHFKCLARDLRIDVIHCDNKHTSPTIGAALGGVRVRVWTKHSMSPAFEEARPPTTKERLCLSVRTTCRLCSCVMAVSTMVRDELLSLRISAGNIVVRNNPVFTRMLPSNYDRRAIRKSWGWEPDDLVIIALGHAVPVKGWDLLLTAFREVVKAAPKARLSLVGSYSGPAEKEHFAMLSGLLRQFGLEAKVAFTGHVPEVKPALCAGDILVLPSRSEGAATTLIEGFDAGLPIIATAVGNARELIRDGFNGCLVPRCDVEALTTALKRVACDDNFRAKLAAASKTPLHIPSIEQFAEQAAQDYETLLSGGKPPVFLPGFPNHAGSSKAEFAHFATA
jgi:glycosyltransferase involved in cell wall biosynthesis